MRISSQFDIGDKIISIRKNQTRVFKDCDFCPESGGYIFSVDKTDRRRCPRCLAKGRLLDYLVEEFIIGGSITVRKIQLDVTKKGVTTEIYTDWETGGGKYFYVENLFNTINEAQAECDKRIFSLTFSSLANTC